MTYKPQVSSSSDWTHQQVLDFLEAAGLQAFAVDVNAGSVLGRTGVAQRSEKLGALLAESGQDLAALCLKTFRGCKRIHRHFHPALELKNAGTFTLSPFDGNLYVIERPPPPECTMGFAGAQPAQLLLESMDDGVTVLSNLGVVLYANEAALALRETQREQFIGKSIFDYYDLPTALAKMADLQTVVRDGKTLHREIESAMSDEPRYLSLRMSRVGCSQPSCGCVMSVVRDVTAERQAQLNLKALEESRALLFRQIPGLIWALDTNLRLTLAEGSGFAKLGFTRQKILGQPLEKVLKSSPETINEVKRQSLRCLRGDQISYRVAFKGYHFAVHGEPFQDGTGKIIGALFVSLDITDYIDVQQRLVESESRLAEAQEIGGIGMYDWNLFSGQVRWNPVFYRIAGLEPSGEFLSIEEVRAMVHPEDMESVRQKAREALSSEHQTSFEYRLVRPDGEVRHIFSTCAVRKNEDGSSARIAGTAVDITERKQSEAAILEAQRAAEEANRAKSEFLANISHEIRSPLTPIFGLVEILQEKEHNKEKKEYLNIIEDSGNRLLGLINDVLDISRIEAGHVNLNKTVFNVQDVIQRLARQIRFSLRESRVELDLKLADDLPSASYTDKSRLNQILSNLLGNAVKFTKEGRITFSARPAKMDGVDGLAFSVADTGIGIPEEQLEKIFTAFHQVDSTQTRPQGGAGLGLAICLKLTEALGGSLHAENNPNGGATFHLLLPTQMPEGVVRDSQGVLVAPKEDWRSFAKQYPLKILLAEDDPMNRQVTLTMLGQLGYRADSVEDGKAAYETIVKEIFDLVILDIHMPHKDGYSVAREVTTHPNFKPAETKLVGFTANALVEERKRCLAAGMAEYLTKPAGVRDFRALIQRLYGEGKGG